MSLAELTSNDGVAEDVDTVGGIAQNVVLLRDKEKPQEVVLSEVVGEVTGGVVVVVDGVAQCQRSPRNAPLPMQSNGPCSRSQGLQTKVAESLFHHA